MAFIVHEHNGIKYALASGHVTGEVKCKRSNKTWYTSFPLAYGSVEEESKRVRQYINITIFGGKARFARNLEIGDCIVITGRYQTRTFIGKDGKEHVWEEIVCDTIMVQQYKYTTAIDRTKKQHDDDDEDMQYDMDDGVEGERPKRASKTPKTAKRTTQEWF